MTSQTSMRRSNPSTSVDGFLKATVTFQDPAVEGQSLQEVARSYRPLMDVERGQWMSCFFERIGPGTGLLKLGVRYKVLIRLQMMQALEQHHHKTVRQLFPRGRRLRMVSLPERLVATGVVEEVVSALH